MTLRERIEQIAREAAIKIAKGYIHRDDHYPPRYSVDEIANEIAEGLKHDLARILIDPQVGFKEALEYLANDTSPAAVEDMAKAKLKELEELSK